MKSVRVELVYTGVIQNGGKLVHTYCTHKDGRLSTARMFGKALTSHPPGSVISVRASTQDGDELYPEGAMYVRAWPVKADVDMWQAQQSALLAAQVAWEQDPVTPYLGRLDPLREAYRSLGMDTTAKSVLIAQVVEYIVEGPNGTNEP